MNREIKFRGKCSKGSKYAGEWVEGGLVVPQEINDNEVLIIRAHADNCKLTYHIDADSIGQFSGLHDKNGKEIYEGDIIRVKEYSNDAIDIFDYNELLQLNLEDVKGHLTKEWTGEVKFEESAFSVSNYYMSAFHGDMRHSYPIFEIEVIGNIFDNPELLEG